MATFFLLCLLILTTPYLIHGHTAMSLGDKRAEAIVLFSLVGIGAITFLYYRRELKKRDRSATELMNYIGNVNVQISEIKEAHAEIKKYPENKNDLKYAFGVKATSILGLVDADWVVLRVISGAFAETLFEFAKSRGGKDFFDIKISNRYICKLKKDYNEYYSVIKTDFKNFDLIVVCVLPKTDLDPNQKMLVHKIVSDLEMLYLIYSSIYYMNTGDTKAVKHIAEKKGTGIKSNRLKNKELAQMQ